MLLVLGAATYYDLTQVRSDVTSARDTLVRAFADPAALRTPEGRATTHARVDSAIQTLAAARRRAAGSTTISLLRFVPSGTSQRTGLIGLIDDASSGAGAVRDLLDKVDSLADRTDLHAGRVPLEGLAELSQELRVAAGAIRGAARPRSGLWGPLQDANDRFGQVARSSSDRLSHGADAIDATATFMGATGDRRYLLALMNNAEMRDQGMVLSYSITRFEGGRLSFDKGGSVQDLDLDHPAPTPVPSGTSEVFGSINPTGVWQSVNATADFAWSGRAMTDMYLQKTGQAVDGVIAVDVPGIAALLRALGPVTIDGVNEPIGADNVARVLLHDAYEGLPPGSDQSQRRELLAEVTQAVTQRLTQGTDNVVALGRELGDAAKGGHLRLWSATGAEEQTFERSGLGGGPATVDGDRTFHLAVENRTATKLDYYVKPSVRQQITLTDRGTAVVRTTVEVDNQAPPDAAPSYQLGPDEVTKKPGDYRAWVLLWGPAGSTQDAATPESGLTLSQHVVPVGAGGRVEISFETVIPGAVRNGGLEVRLVPQSRLEPMPIEVTLDAPGWSIDGPASYRGPWDHVLTLRWRVHR